MDEIEGKSNDVSEDVLAYFERYNETFTEMSKKLEVEVALGLQEHTEEKEQQDETEDATDGEQHSSEDESNEEEDSFEQILAKTNGTVESSEDQIQEKEATDTERSTEEKQETIAQNSIPTQEELDAAFQAISDQIIQPQAINITPEDMHMVSGEKVVANGTSNEEVFGKEKTPLQTKKKTNSLKKGKLLYALFGGAAGIAVLIMVMVQISTQKKEAEGQKRIPTSTRKPFFDSSLDITELETEEVKEPEIAEVNTKDYIVVEPESEVWKEVPSYETAKPEVPKTIANPALQAAVRAPLRKNIGLAKNANVVPVESKVDSLQEAKNRLQYLQNSIPTKEEYTEQALSKIKSLTGQSSMSLEQLKYDTVNNGRYTKNGAYNHQNTSAGNIRVIDKNSIFPGTIINAVLVTSINTDYPANIIARVIDNVYDSETGKNLLIPQGSIIQGAYSSSSIGISRVQIAWDTLLVSKDGLTYMTSLGGMAGVDSKGNAGINGTLNDHYFAYLKAAGIMAMYTVMSSEISLSTAGQKDVVQDVLGDTQGIINSLGARLIDRAMDIQPTVTVKNGTKVSVLVNTPVTLVPYKAYDAKERYER